MEEDDDFEDWLIAREECVMDLDNEELEATRRLNGVDKKSNIKEYKLNLTNKQSIDFLKNILNKFEIRGEELYLLKIAIEHILAEREADKKTIAELKEYIAIAPNLDEMTATKYTSIQRDAYIRGRAEEQQKAEEIINKDYISKQKVKDVVKEAIERLEKRIKDNEDYKTTQVWLTDDVSAVYTVLNMLKRQQIDIEIYEKELDKIYKVLNIERGVAAPGTAEIIKTLKNTVSEQMNMLKEKDKEAKQYFKTTIVQAEKFDAELEKKDKIIDLMAERIEWLCKSNGILLDKEHDENFTQEDIKQYFERKTSE